MVYGAKYFKIEYTTQKIESLDIIVNQFVAKGEKFAEQKKKLIKDIKNKNSNVKNWNKIPFNTTFSILISAVVMSDPELNAYVAKEEKKKKENERIKEELRIKKENLLNTTKQKFIYGYTIKSVDEDTDSFKTSSNIVPNINIGYEFSHSRFTEIWKLKRLLYTVSLEIKNFEDTNLLSIPLEIDFNFKTAWENAFNTFSPYLGMQYLSTPNISQTSSSLVVRESSAINIGFGLNYFNAFKSKFALDTSFDYYIGVSSSTSVPGTSDSLGVGILSFKMDLLYDFKLYFINKVFGRFVYTMESYSGDKNSLSISANRMSFYVGVHF